jgi:pyruvate/2-oxoglutarate dehydrogenase complex dihydrolipoamide dehydrogenase (E3) component
VPGRARLLPGAPVRVRLDDGTVLSARRGVVLATGSRPLGTAALAPGSLPDPLLSGCRVSTTDGWLDALEAHVTTGAPGPVVVVGGGASGTELAQALARLGAAGPDGPVVLLESGPHLLPGVPGAGEVLARALREDGVTVVTGADATAVAERVVPGALVLLTTGRAPVLDVLVGTDVATTAAGVVVDASMRTSVPGVCAAGDVTGLRPSTHVAAATGRIAAATLLGREVRFRPEWAPRVVYTDPEVAAVGEVPGPVGSREVRAPVSRVDRATVATLPDGRSRQRARGGSATVWVVPDGSSDLTGSSGWDHGGRLAGALVVGPHAGELIGEVALAGRLGLSVEDWTGGVTGIGSVAAQRPYPAWSWWWESVAEVLLRR